MLSLFHKHGLFGLLSDHMVPYNLDIIFLSQIILYAHGTDFPDSLIIFTHVRTVYFGPNISSPLAVLTMCVTPSFFKKSVFMTALNPPWKSPPSPPCSWGRIQLGVFSPFCEYSSACVDNNHAAIFRLIDRFKCYKFY